MSDPHVFAGDLRGQRMVHNLLGLEMQVDREPSSVGTGN